MAGLTAYVNLGWDPRVDGGMGAASDMGTRKETTRCQRYTAPSSISLVCSGMVRIVRSIDLRRSFLSHHAERVPRPA